MAVVPTPPSHSRATTEEVLVVRNLQAAFFTRRGVVRAINDVSFGLRAGETLGLVGESGSGKSVTAMAILGVIPFPGRITGGEILFRGENLLDKSESQLRRIRGRDIALIPQDPTASLNPLLTVGGHLLEVLGVHLGLGGEKARRRAIDLLATVGIPEPERRLHAYPHQLSGGMRQRVMIAMAIACEPSLLIADEPTTALDATVQAQILDMIRSLSKQLNTATILITHNLGIVAGSCDRVAVMYSGRIAEAAPRDELFAHPRHPYTVGLLSCVPRLDRVGVADLRSIPGQPPDMLRLPVGCAFAARCALASDQCREFDPRLVGVGRDHEAACWHADQVGRLSE